MKTSTLYLLKQKLVGAFKSISFLFLFFLLSCCKKSEQEAISISEVFFTSIKSDQVDINYKLSELGYQETGVYFYKKTTPKDIQKLKAIRRDGILYLSLQGLDPDTEYVFNIFYKQNDREKIDEKEHLVKTLLLSDANFAIKVVNNPILVDENGDFTVEIEGENLNELNLADLEIRIANAVTSFGHPVSTSGNSYKITLTGKAQLIDGNRLFIVLYKGKEIFFQAVPFSFTIERYWLSYNPTNLRGYRNSVFKNELYYFINNSVSKWSESEQRMLPVGTANSQNGFNIGTDPGIEFDNKLFFPPVIKSVHTGQDLSISNSYPQAYSYSPTDNLWLSYPFENKNYPQRNRMIHNANFFIQGGELFLTYSLTDEAWVNPLNPPPSENLLYRYNRLSKQFDEINALTDKIQNYHFISIDEQLYLLGLAPVYDQGFELSATLCVYKVNPQTFQLQEIYRGGTIHQPETLRVKYVVNHEGNILMGISINDYRLFNPENLKLFKIYQRNNISGTYFDGFFNYNQKIHLIANANFTSQKVYEISIEKGR